MLHTLDVSAAHSAHAERLVRGFRRGLYAGDVDFHVGDLPAFFARADGGGDARPLSHVVLDMPSSHEQLERVGAHMRDDAALLVFSPSVTQIADCVGVVHEGRLPLRLERVVELAGGFAGGRDWDVRVARIRRPDSVAEVRDPRSWFQKLLGLGGAPAVERPRHAMVCRPRAGGSVVVGGFVGLWRRSSE